ncbi:MAG: ABC transporter ATP-binding protein [Proteobacteria bacterium]|nr:ABC transporter ATP-binding protein [Pseudomonadota bacterium]
MTEPTYKLQTRDLRKTYGSVIALAGTNISVPEGEFLTLLGPSGSGKTTMLMLIAGLLQPDSGELWINGRLSTYMPPNKRDIGMVFQNYALFPHMSIAENIGFPLRMRKIPAADIRKEVQRVLDIVQLPDVGERRPSQLSGGQQQRIALARCMVYQPPIILMDEPLGALDKKLREQLQLEIRNLHQKLGITVLYVTHDQEEALVMSDRICLMNEGEIEQLGSPDDLYFRPETVFAADFLGESNILQSKVTGVSSDVVTLEGPAGASIKVEPRGEIENGRQIKFMLRPENIRVLKDGETRANVLTGRVLDVILVGQVTKYYAALSDGTEVIATELTRRGGRTGHNQGDEIRFGFEPDAAVLLPRETRSGGDA